MAGQLTHWLVRAVYRTPDLTTITGYGVRKTMHPLKVQKDLFKDPGCWLVLDKAYPIEGKGGIADVRRPDEPKMRDGIEDPAEAFFAKKGAGVDALLDEGKAADALASKEPTVEMVRMHAPQQIPKRR